LDETDRDEGWHDKVEMTVNGAPVSGEVEGRTLLVEFLRDHLRLTGTHVGCDTSQCGACVVHVDGLPVKACTALALDVAGAEVVTIEGLAAPDGDALARCRRRFGSITGCNAASARRA
jgi:aerobic-type carbon monoxide dehydrogenase small subunit (CoxS/CutS family)